MNSWRVKRALVTVSQRRWHRNRGRIDLRASGPLPDVRFVRRVVMEVATR
jgi:hypothetical protein